MTFPVFLTYFILIVSVANIIRITLYLVGSDIYAVKSQKRNKLNKKKRSYVPTVSLIVPAHNEEMIIEETLDCLMQLDYPSNKLQIIIANDGSTDNTLKVVRRYKRKFDREGKLQVFTQPNGGKADVLNNAIRSKATGKLIMCLDADSLLAPDAIRKAVTYFRDRRTVALASNVNIMEDGSLLGLAQRFEYLISYQMKKAQTLYNIEYIIGGIGSMFRRSMLDKVNLYDTNTMTEDIDLTMKIIAKGNKSNRVVYGNDVISYTQAVPSFKSLVTQRFRWKYGRLQTFLKNKEVFFNKHKKYTKLLTWFILPVSIVQELLFTLEPLIVTFILGISIYYQNLQTILIAWSIISFYIIVNICSVNHLDFREKTRLSILAPSMYVFLYILSVVEYLALMRTLRKLPKLSESISQEKVTWVSPERSRVAKA